MTRNLIIVTGLSGAGKSTVIRALEDLGFYTIDNLPMVLFDSLLGIDYLKDFDIALGVDVRDVRNIELLVKKLEAIPKDIKREVLFIEADIHTIVGRYKETRRNHPLGDPIIERAVEKERELLSPLREFADRIIDTTNLTSVKLRDLIRSIYHHRDKKKLILLSFSYSKGIPSFSDMVIDARSLPNPHYEPKLRSLTGLDGSVAEFLEGFGEVRAFLDQVFNFIKDNIDSYYRDGRSLFIVSIGCTGGKHRSVYMVEELYRRLEPVLTGSYEICKFHREL